MTKQKKNNFTYSSGKRRTASARIRLFKGKEESLVNGKTLSEYFPGSIMESLYTKPLELTDTFEKYYFTAKVSGGGKRGQLEALVHGLSKALSNLDPEKYRGILKKAGLLTRDSRIRERRKIGMGGKARRKKQSPKR